MESKPFWQSKTLWGTLAMFLVGLGNTFDVEVPFTADAASDAVMTIIAVGGFVLALVGRAKATKSISLT